MPGRFYISHFPFASRNSQHSFIEYQSFSNPLRRRNRTKSIRRRPGVILVLVLLMITLCACIAAQVASRTIRLTGQAADSQRELQARWALVSIRRTLLNDASTLLTDRTSDPSATKFLTFREDNIVLGGNRYQLILQDESAKAPIARMLQTKNQQEVKPILRQLLQGRAILQPNIPSKPQQWRDVIDLPNPMSSAESLAILREATIRMTLWSDGLLNILTSDRATLDAVWRFQFNAPSPDFLTSFRQTGSLLGGLDTHLKTHGLNESQREFANTWLTTTSSSYSLWITQSSSNGKSLATIYVRRTQLGYSEEHFGFHNP